MRSDTDLPHWQAAMLLIFEVAMYIEKIHIDTFGKLDNRDFTLDSGVNIIEGANESGKSTIAAFIRFIFYGASSKERETIASWRSGGAAGSITVHTENRRYRIERALIGTREAVQLIDAATNMPIRGALDGTTPGELFFGLDADMFSATAFVSELGAASGSAKVSEGIENILFSADESVNTQKALSKLDSARAVLLHKNEKGGRLFELDNECAEIEVRLAAALNTNREIQTKEAQLADIRVNHASADEKAQSVGAKVAQFEAVMVKELFERMHALEKKVSSLRAAIDQSGAPDPDYMNQISGMIDRIAHLKREFEEASQRLDEEMTPTLSGTAKEYSDAGGREALEAECRSARSVAKTYTVIGVIVLLLGLGALAIGLLPLLGGGAPQVGFVVGGAVIAAIAVTLLILGAQSRRKAEAIEDEYDFDALDAELKKYKAAVDEVKYNELAVVDVRRRYDEARAQAKQIVGIEPDELGAEYAKLQELMKKAEGLKAEYDKHSTLLAHMREQLASYNEAELRDRIDPSVDISDIDASNLPSLRREAEVASKMAAALEKHGAEIEKTLAGLYPTAEDPSRLADKLSAMKLEREELSKKHAAYKLAYEKLTQASENLRESVAPRLASDAAKLMSEITDGKYRELGVGAQLEMTAVTENGLRSLNVLSSGTQDAAYLSLRIALVKLLYRKTLPPMIYDESFVRQDDARLTNLLKMIANHDMQSIIFTSNDRDGKLMRTIGAFNSITL